MSDTIFKYQKDKKNAVLATLYKPLKYYIGTKLKLI